jgi:hypothetical protein
VISTLWCHVWYHHNYIFKMICTIPLLSLPKSHTYFPLFPIVFTFGLGVLICKLPIKFFEEFLPIWSSLFELLILEVKHDLYPIILFILSSKSFIFPSFYFTLIIISPYVFSIIWMAFHYSIASFLDGLVFIVITS